MKHYAHHGFDDFVVALGYKGEYIKRCMVDYVSLTGGPHGPRPQTASVEHCDDAGCEDWTVSLVDTGQPTATGGRIKRLAAAPGRRDLHAHLGRRRLRRRPRRRCSPSTAPTASSPR